MYLMHDTLHCCPSMAFLLCIRCCCRCCCSEELKRRNESLKQAIGLFLDQPGDVGAVTGKPTGTWDEDSTASLLETLRQQRAAAGSSYLGSGEEEAVSFSPGSSPSSPGSPASPSSSSTSAASAAAAADGRSGDLPQPGELDLQQQQQPWEQVQQQVGLEQLAEGEALPPGPVFDTSMPGTMWQEAAAAAEAAAAEAAAAEAEVEAAAEAAAAAAAAAAKAAAPAADAPTGAAAGPVMSVAEALAAVVPDAVAPGTSSSNGVPSPAAAAAAAPVLTPPDAPPSSITVTAKPLGSIHERVEQLEQQLEQQKQKKGSKQKQAMKPRATGRQLLQWCTAARRLQVLL